MSTLLGENWGLWEDSEWGIGPEQESGDPVNPLKGHKERTRWSQWTSPVSPGEGLSTALEPLPLLDSMH